MRVIIMENKKKLGNQGFSLVELIVVMALIIILGSATVYGLTFLASKPVEECARKIEIGLQGNRNSAMGKLTAHISFFVDDEDVYISETLDTNTKQTLIASGVEVYYTYKSNPTNKVLLGTSPLTVEFDRSSGSLKPRPGTTDDFLQSIIVKRGSKELTVTIERLTGRVTIN